MKKQQLARRLAKESRMTEGAAADQVDRILSDLQQLMRNGQSASLPGLGTFRSGRKRDFPFDPPKNKKESR
jgi:nucleoid DNA-binding protein